MSLLLLDLDNTLVDRDGAFRRWAARFVAAHGSGPHEVEWLINVDRDGLASREAVATSIAGRFELEADAYADVLTTLHDGFVDDIEVDRRLGQSLDDARAAGWATVVVSNGTVKQQERKLRSTGLDRHVDAWVISEHAGAVKPDPHIFRLAAATVARPLIGWMVGDNAEADIAGAQSVGLSTAWLHRGRQWTPADYRPTRIVDTCAEAIDEIVGLAIR